MVDREDRGGAAAACGGQGVLAEAGRGGSGSRPGPTDFRPGGGGGRRWGGGVSRGGLEDVLRLTEGRPLRYARHAHSGRIAGRADISRIVRTRSSPRARRGALPQPPRPSPAAWRARSESVHPVHPQYHALRRAACARKRALAPAGCFGKSPSSVGAGARFLKVGSGGAAGVAALRSRIDATVIAGQEPRDLRRGAGGGRSRLPEGRTGLVADGIVGRRTLAGSSDAAARRTTVEAIAFQPRALALGLPRHLGRKPRGSSTSPP